MESRSFTLITHLNECRIKDSTLVGWQVPEQYMCHSCGMSPSMLMEVCCSGELNRGVSFLSFEVSSQLELTMR